MCKTSILKYFFLVYFLQLYIAKVPIGSGSGSGENYPDPTKKVRIRPDSDPQPCPVGTCINAMALAYNPT